MANGKSTDLDDALDLLIGDTRSAATAALQNQRPTEPTTVSQTPTVAAPGRHRPAPAPEPTAPRPGRGVKKPPQPRASDARPRTRMGRPPGVRSGEGPLKEKTSLSLDQDLMDWYRRQTWKEECQFGELIDRALRDYAKRTWNWPDAK